MFLFQLMINISDDSFPDMEDTSAVLRIAENTLWQ